MYVSALRVVHPRLGERVNTFLYLHGKDFSWPSEPWKLPEEDRGTLVCEGENVPTGGNRIRSYLDVLAPDGTSIDEVHVALTGMWLALFAGESSSNLETPNPAVYVHGSVTVRFGVDPELLPGRTTPLTELMQGVQCLLTKAAREARL